MEKERKRDKKTLLPKASLAREAWVSIVLLLLAVVMIGFGVYFSFQPEWAKRADVKLYNRGVLTYLLPAELLPATDDRPEEYPIVRAAAYFQQAASDSKDDSLRSLALYNLGTLMGGDAISPVSGDTSPFGIADAIIKMEQVVRADPSNEDAKYNLELLEKLQSMVEQTYTWLIGTSGFGSSWVVQQGYASGVVHKGY